MAQVIFAGIDISALKCDLVCLDEQGRQLAPARSFANNRDGASALAEVLDKLVIPYSWLGFVLPFYSLSSQIPFLALDILP